MSDLADAIARDWDQALQEAASCSDTVTARLQLLHAVGLSDQDLALATRTISVLAIGAWRESGESLSVNPVAGDGLRVLCDVVAELLSQGIERQYIVAWLRSRNVYLAHFPPLQVVASAQQTTALAIAVDHLCRDPRTPRSGALKRGPEQPVMERSE
ncbi:MAG: hypothetical protein WBD40_03300 [Tepidisphaeraceae bacterium]